MYTKMVREYINKNKGELFDSSYEHKKLFQLIPYKTYLKIIQRFVNENQMIRISKGIYAIPDEKGKYKSVKTYYTQYFSGMVVGEEMYFRSNLTPYESSEILIYTNLLSVNTRNINEYKLKYIDLTFFKERVNIITALEIIENQYKIRDINIKMYAMLIELAVYSYSDKDFEQIIKKIDYQYSTIEKFEEYLKVKGKYGNPLDIFKKLEK